jgi:NadR type nicotinamide-nucleotide adenylyltransferase
MIKVAVVGAESTGKTTLAKALAEHYRAPWVPEYARQYLENLGHPYTQLDVEAIAKGQITNEDKAATQSPTLLICDTNLLVIKIWMDHAYGNAPKWILDFIELRHYDLYILTDFDIPYEPDPLREHPEMRDYFTALYKMELENLKTKYIYVTGNHETRMSSAIYVINKLLHV